MRRWLLAFAAGRRVHLVPGIALAQSAIAGVVKDTTGAVLPGVTVEASSPALIEKVRSATTNEAGQYRIVDLRPGTYTVTFTLTRIQHGRARGHPARSQLHGADQRRVEGRRGGGERHGHRRNARGRRADQHAPRGRHAGAARSDPDRAQLRADGQYGAGGQHRRSSTSADRARCGPAAACSSTGLSPATRAP